MSIVASLLTALVRADGDALVLHTGECPYVVAPTGQTAAGLARADARGDGGRGRRVVAAGRTSGTGYAGRHSARSAAFRLLPWRTIYRGGRTRRRRHLGRDSPASEAGGSIAALHGRHTTTVSTACCVSRRSAVHPRCTSCPARAPSSESKGKSARWRERAPSAKPRSRPSSFRWCPSAMPLR